MRSRAARATTIGALAEMTSAETAELASEIAGVVRCTKPEVQPRTCIVFDGIRQGHVTRSDGF